MMVLILHSSVSSSNFIIIKSIEMDIFTKLQHHWMNRVVNDYEQALQQAEKDENFEACYELKKELDEGMKRMHTFDLDKYRSTNAYSYPKLAFKLIGYAVEAFGENEEMKKETQGEKVLSYIFTYKEHIYRTLRIEMNEHQDLHPSYIDNGGSREGDFIYVCEKICSCSSKPARFYEIVDSWIEKILKTREQLTQENTQWNEFLF